MISTKHLVIGAGLMIGIIASVLGLRLWLRGVSDPALGGNPAAYARATGVLMTPSGIIPVASFGDGPGRISVSAALALVGQTNTACEDCLGKPDRVADAGGAHPIALWWNSVTPEHADPLQPPVFHLRLDLAADGTVVRAACLGSRLVEITATPR